MFVTETDHSVGFSMASRLPKKKRNYYGLRIAAGKPEAGVDSGIGDDYAALLGWAITDGSIAFTSAGRPYLGIGQKKPVGIMKLDAIGHLFDHRAAYRKSDGSEVVSFSMGVEATEIFMRCVGWWPDEPLVPVVMNMSSSERRAMFEAMVDADGSRRVRKYGRSRLPESLSFGAAESHKAVLDGDVEHVFTVLLALLGFGASYTYRRLHSGKRFTDISVLDQAMVHNYIYEPGEIEEEVWCPKTGTGTWVMRQGGKILITGNCSEPNLQNIPRFEGFSGSKTGAIAENIISQIEAGITYSSTGKHGKIAITKEQLAEQRKKLAELVAAQKKEIPIEAEDGDLSVDYEFGEAIAKVRGAFVATEPDEDLWFIDFQQMEMRVFADYANEIALLTAFDFGLDIHEVTAKSAFGDLVPSDRHSQEYKWYRNMGKQIAFGLIYGMGIKLLAIEIRRTQNEAKEFMVKYFTKFPNAKSWIDFVQTLVVDQGYLVNKYGRRRYLDEDKIYVGVNFLVQGTCADMVKSAMNKIDQAIADRGFKSRMLLSIHDELIFSVKRDEVEEFIPMAVELMTDYAGIIKAKMAVDVEWGGRWSEKESISCKRCDGRGFLVELEEDALYDLLVTNRFAELNALHQDPCPVCSGRGFDLELWRNPSPPEIHKQPTPVILGLPKHEVYAHADGGETYT